MTVKISNKWIPFGVCFCLRPSAKDLGITRIVVLVLVLFLSHLSHFLFKRSLSEKNYP